MTTILESPTAAPAAPKPTRTIYERPGTTGSIVPLRSRYENFIGGEWVKPRQGLIPFDLAPRYRGWPSPSTRTRRSRTSTWLCCRKAGLPRVGGDIHRGSRRCAFTPSPTGSRCTWKRSRSWSHGRTASPCGRRSGADIPLAIDHFRYFAAAIRTQEGTIKKLSAELVSYHFYEPIGVVAQIIPWNFPILMAGVEARPRYRGR